MGLVLGASGVGAFSKRLMKVEERNSNTIAIASRSKFRQVSNLWHIRPCRFSCLESWIGSFATLLWRLEFCSAHNGRCKHGMISDRQQVEIDSRSLSRSVECSMGYILPATCIDRRITFTYPAPRENIPDTQTKKKRESQNCFCYDLENLKFYTRMTRGAPIT